MRNMSTFQVAMAAVCILSFLGVAQAVNLWNDPGSRDLKGGLLLKFIHAEFGKEPMWMPRVSAA